MSDPYLSELRIFAFNYAPRGWAFCNGQVLPINQNQAIFSLLGTTYGGDGITNFALPDLRGRAAIAAGPGYTPGMAGGEAAHVLTITEMPTHVHGVNAKSGQADTGAQAVPPSPATSLAQAYAVPAGGGATPVDRYANAGANGTGGVSPLISTVGGGGGHENRQPFLSLNYCIALEGVFPSHN